MVPAVGRVERDQAQGAGQSGLKKVAVTLPLSVALEPDNAEALCTPAQAAARAWAVECSYDARVARLAPLAAGDLSVLEPL